MLKPFTQYLEQVMQNTDAYLFVLTICLLLAPAIVWSYCLTRSRCLGTLSNYE